MKWSCGGIRIRPLCNYEFFFSFLFQPLDAISSTLSHNSLVPFFVAFCCNEKDTHRGSNAIVKITSGDSRITQWYGKCRKTRQPKVTALTTVCRSKPTKMHSTEAK